MEFQEFIRRHGEKAYNFAYRLAGNEQDARDLVQEAFARALQHQESYDAARPFDSWLHRILHNIYLDGVRRYAHRHTVSLDSPSPVEDEGWEEIIRGSDADPADLVVRQEKDLMIQKALNSLPAVYRSAVVLCDIEGLSYERIGEIMACPLGTVRSRIHHGRMLVRKAFEELEKKGERLQ